MMKFWFALDGVSCVEAHKSEIPADAVTLRPLTSETGCAIMRSIACYLLHCSRGPMGINTKSCHIIMCTPHSWRKEPQWLHYLPIEPAPLSLSKRARSDQPWRCWAPIWLRVINRVRICKDERQRSNMNFTPLCNFHRMDDPVIFLNFVNNISVTVARARNEVLDLYQLSGL